MLVDFCEFWYCRTLQFDGHIVRRCVDVCLEYVILYDVNCLHRVYTVFCCELWVGTVGICMLIIYARRGTTVNWFHAHRFKIQRTDLTTLHTGFKYFIKLFSTWIMFGSPKNTPQISDNYKLLNGYWIYNNGCLTKNRISLYAGLGLFLVSLKMCRGSKCPFWPSSWIKPHSRYVMPVIAFYCVNNDNPRLHWIGDYKYFYIFYQNVHIVCVLYRFYLKFFSHSISFLILSLQLTSIIRLKYFISATVILFLSCWDNTHELSKWV